MYDLRDYFAAHAPSEPQRWFAPVMSAPRPVGDLAKEHVWDLEYEKQCCVQWPWAWADATIAARFTEHRSRTIGVQK